MFFEEKHFYTSLSYLNTITFNSWTWAQNNKNGKKWINYKKKYKEKNQIQAEKITKKGWTSMKRSVCKKKNKKKMFIE